MKEAGFEGLGAFGERKTERKIVAPRSGLSALGIWVWTHPEGGSRGLIEGGWRDLRGKEGRKRKAG